MSMKLWLKFLCIAAISRSGLADSTVRPNLAYSTPFGGTGQEVATAIAVDADGNAYITGRTNSADFPVVHGFQARLGGMPLRISTDSGSTWSAPNLAAAVVSIAAAPGAIWVGTNKGIYVSTDSATAWTPITSLRPATVSAVVIDATNLSIILACTQSGIFRSSDSGNTWTITAASLPGGAGCTYLAAGPSGTSDLLADLGFTIYRSTDGGASWVSTGIENPYAFTFDPTIPNAVYALYSAASGEQFAKSSDGGVTWGTGGVVTLRGAAAGTLEPQSLAVTGTALIAATASGVFGSTDGGATWNSTSITAPASIVVSDVTNPQVLYCNADRLYISSDGGINWSPILAPSPNFVYTIGAGTAGPSTVLVGSLPPTDNAFVTKMSADGTQILYSTYLGGSEFDYPTGIAVDTAGNAYVAGVTYSPDFPATADALQKVLPATSSAFLAKINPDGSKLLYATFLGGSTADAAYAIALDRPGNIYLTGWAGSADFPVTTGAFQTQIHQNCSVSPFVPVYGDAFIAKISGDGHSLLYSTFLGGACADIGLGIAVDSSGSAYVAGVTDSPDFPTTRGVVQERAPNPEYGYNSGFLAKMNPQGTALVYATYVGGPLPDVAQAVAVDGSGNAYVTGTSYGFTQETLSNQWCGITYGLWGYWAGPGYNMGQFAISSGGSAFLLKLDPKAANQLSLLSLGECYAAGNSIEIDPKGRVWFAGVSGTAVSDAWWFTGSGPIEVSTVPTLHPFQGDFLGWGFVAQASPDGGTLLYSSLLDWEAGLGLDEHGNAYVAGATRNTTQPKQEFVPGYLNFSALALGIETDVACPLTIEAPQDLPQSEQPGGAYGQLAIAPAAVAYVTGSGLGPAQAIGPEVTGGQVSTSLGGTTLYFDGIPAPLLSVQDQQVEFVVPFEAAIPPAGTAPVVSQVIGTVQVMRNGLLSNSIRLAVGIGVIEVLGVVNQDGTANSSTNPAAQGSVITVYAAGMGQTVPPSVDGQINGTDPVGFPSAVNSVIDAGPVSQVAWAGPAPGEVAGINQVNVSLPTLTPGYHLLGVGFGTPLDGSYGATAIYVAK